MRYIMPARLALGGPNGDELNWSPLINPIPLETQLLGTSRPDMESTAEILKNLGGNAQWW